MKQIIYGPTGFGKTHLILHSLKHKRGVILISSNGVAEEMKNVGLSPLPEEDIFKLSPIEGKWKLNHKTEIGFDIIGLAEEQTYALEQLFTSLEKAKITKNTDYTIVIINMYCLIGNRQLIKRIEKWSADVIIDLTCVEREVDKADIEIEMGCFRKSGKWAELFLSTNQKQKNITTPGNS